MISLEKHVKVDSVNFPTALDKWAPCLSYKSQQTAKDL